MPAASDRAEGGIRQLARAIAASPEQTGFGQHLLGILRGEASVQYHFQPIVELRHGVAAGYEGLVRFKGGPDWPPDRWFAEAERHGLRIALEEAVTRGLLERQALLPPNCFLSINVSPSFVLSPQWEELLAGGRRLGGLVVEITENEAVDDYAPLLKRIEQIRERGGHVAVDDAGSGYASLHHVMALRPDFVKLDRVFVTGCDTDRAKSALIEMVGKASSRLDAWIIAEGVETAGELDELLRLEVPLAEGYFLGRPQPEMRPVAEETAKAITWRGQALAASQTIEAAMEFCPLCPDLAGAMELVSADRQVSATVVTNPSGRPEQLVERHPLMGVRTVPAPMKVQAGTSCREALERALTRPADSRWDSLLAINELGEFVGVARIDRLVRLSLMARR